MLCWFCFALISVLYMKFCPDHRKSVQLVLEEPGDARTSLLRIKTRVMSFEWRSSLLCAWVALAHFAFSSVTTLYLMLTAVPTPAPDIPLPAPVQSRATFLGVISAILAAIQYAPQLVHTYTHKVVGASSIPMMCMQSPGAVLMIHGIALRPGTNWTSWFTFLVAGVMQATLLVMCIVWNIRQRRLGIDDFGNPLAPPVVAAGPMVVDVSSDAVVEDERTPLVPK